MSSPLGGWKLRGKESVVLGGKKSRQSGLKTKKTETFLPSNFMLFDVIFNVNLKCKSLTLESGVATGKIKESGDAVNKQRQASHKRSNYLLCGFNCATQFNPKRGGDRRRRCRTYSEGEIIWERDDWKEISLAGICL